MGALKIAQKILNSKFYNLEYKNIIFIALCFIDDGKNNRKET